MGGEQQTLQMSATAEAQPTEPPEDNPKGRRGVWSRVLLAASIVFVVLVTWKAWPELRDAVGVMRTISPLVLLVALALEGGAVAALAQVYRATVAAMGERVSYRQGLQVSMGAFTLSRVLPGGGPAGAVWAARRLRHFGLPLAQAGTVVIVGGLLAMATLGGIVAGGTVAALLRGHANVGSVIGAVAVAAAFAGAGWAAVAGIRSPAARRRFLALGCRLVPKAEERLVAWGDALDDLALSLPPARRLATVIGWSIVNWGLDIAALWVVFIGLGYQLEFGVLILGFGVANLVNALPHTPGGLGLVEAGMTGTYVALGTPVPVALAAVLAYRLISFWLPVMAGVPQYLRPPARSRKERK